MSPIKPMGYWAGSNSPSPRRLLYLFSSSSSLNLLLSAMAENLFLGLPPPSSTSTTTPSAAVVEPPPVSSSNDNRAPSPLPPPPPRPALKSALKSALKRDKPPEPPGEAGPSQKRLRFKTTTDATTTQVIEAMQRIASHIKNPSKISKATKLALQLIQAGSVRDGTGDHFFAILEAAVSSPVACTDPSVRADYQALFSAAQDVKECLTEWQRNQLTTWTVKAVVANDLYTDDSFVFSKAAGKIKEAISSLPAATGDEDIEEAASLENSENGAVDIITTDSKNTESDNSPRPKEEASDPFGLDALLPGISNKDEKAKGKKEVASKKKALTEEESKRFFKSQREALILCLETAARRYKVPWAQTVIDILVKYAFDNADRFTSQQRDAIGKLWTSIREQHIRRKQGKSVTSKLDMNAFEFLQEKYSNQKISIRHSVGGGGERRAQQWLG